MPKNLAKDERCISLYGEPGGRWMLVTTRLGEIPPAIIPMHYYDERMPDGGATGVELRYMGAPSDVITLVYKSVLADGLEAGVKRIPAQQKIADILGMPRQQSVSFYMTKGRCPNLSDAGWKALVQLSFGEVEVALALALDK